MASEVLSSGKQPMSAAFGRGVEGLVGRWWFWVLLVGSISGFNVVRAVFNDMPKAPKTYYKVPSFSMTDQRGEPYGLHDLEGKIWIANFMFTSCPTVCKGLTETMAKLQKKLRQMGDSVMLVSFTVDPENDTPAALANYAKEAGAAPGRWRFLTGDLEEIKRTIVDGFKMPLDKSEPMDTNSQLMNIVHGTRLVLVDQAGQIRGYYETNDEEMSKMMGHISVLTRGDRIPGLVEEFEKSVDQTPN